MKKHIIQNRLFLIFLFKFLVVYLVFTGLYQYYLSFYDSVNKEVDYITQIVADQTNFIVSFFDNSSYTALSKLGPSIDVFYFNKAVITIIEGCNAGSVIILYISFIVAFRGKFIAMLSFVFLGSIIIYVFNVLRIALLTISLYYYPNLEHILHGVIFPLFIYGVVFVIWIVWIKKYALFNDKRISSNTV